jgi:hypothetical protein
MRTGFQRGGPSGSLPNVRLPLTVETFGAAAGHGRRPPRPPAPEIHAFLTSTVNVMTVLEPGAQAAHILLARVANPPRLLSGRLRMLRGWGDVPV